MQENEFFKDKDKFSEAEKQRASHSLWYYSWIRFKRNKLAMAGLITLILLILVAVSAGILAPYDPNDQTLEYATKPSGFKGNVLVKKALDGTDFIPIRNINKITHDSVFYADFSGSERSIAKSELINGTEEQWHIQPEYLLGTDRYGRDILSRLIYGSRISLSVGVISESIAIIIGVILGALAGYFRGKTDAVIMWFINVVWSFPSILFIIALSVVLGKGFWQSFVAIGLTGWVDIARIVRGQFFSLRETEYVEATRALGYKPTRIIFKHILPNTIGPIIVTGTAGLATAIIFEASLSFLGLGVQPPTASWGQMVFDGYKYIVAGTNYGLALYPSLAIMITVFAVNLIGDGLRDAFDPKMRR
ncbi:MAG TPA: ABC transporter permease [Ignavibacteria bacterium]|nr:peptide transporter [Bacteroidota bacterium]HRE09936.1 ABC transporter permease [Ignavibacteria bacterium]HRF66376.1 ABC transporter permease [Ignavibacteria bacterium]HRJ05480.1 ABC transporter permease [Ignavibacteria bacterium]HRJ85824.1 ABC transporter permease [Ignavibacteria bacterium]